MKTALLFWWLALTPTPSNTGMSVGIAASGQGEFVSQGIHQLRPALFDDLPSCQAEQQRLNESHQADIVIVSWCGVPGAPLLAN